MFNRPSGRGAEVNKPKKYFFGKNTAINNNVSIISESAGITIGRDCLIGCNVEIIDSLRAQLKTIHDTLKPGIYNDISWEYRNSDIPKCIENAIKDIGVRFK